MSKDFLFLSYELKSIEGRDFVCVYILEFHSKHVFSIYKLSNKEFINHLSTLKKLDNVNTLINYNIKKDGRLSLDIRF